MLHRECTTILIAFLISIGLHLLILPVAYSNKQPMTHVPPAKATHLETPSEEPPAIELGIDSSKESTLTWIGYEEYEEHRVRFAEVEQASMKFEVELAQPAPQPLTISAMQQLSTPLSDIAIQFLEALQGIEITTPSRDLPIAQPEENVVVAQPTVPSIDTSEELPVEGAPSDRDSDATSIVHITPEQWKSGKPLAAQGIVLRPRRPSFTANQLVVNAPSNLVAELHINHRGKPQNVVILLSTGSRSIDRSLESSLYRWRASGDQIDELRDGNTFKITIHITFSN